MRTCLYIYGWVGDVGHSSFHKDFVIETFLAGCIRAWPGNISIMVLGPFGFSSDGVLNCHEFYLWILECTC